MDDAMTPEAMDRVTDYETAAERCKAELRLWLRLLSCTNLIENAIRTRLRETFDVTLPQFDLLAALEREPEGLTMGELSRRLMVSNGNVTGITERLASEGLVAREPSPSDRRAFVVKLTPAGRRAFLAMAMVHEGWIADFFDDLKGEEIDSLMGLLGKAKQAVHAKTRNGRETP